MLNWIKIVCACCVILTTACKPGAERAYETSFALRAAREIDSAGDSATARYYLERAAREDNVRDEAQAFLRRVSERRLRTPDCVDAKKTDLAINQYPRIRHKHLFQMGLCLELSGDTGKALKFYDMSEAANSRQPQLFIRRGLLREQLGDVRGAAGDFEKAAALNKEYPPALLSLGLFQVRQNETGAAEQTLAQVRTTKLVYAEILADAIQHAKAIQDFSRGKNATH